MMAKRSPPTPFIAGSIRPIAALAAIAASTALPPRSRICTPARAASGWLAATIPYLVAIRDRPAMTLIAGSYQVHEELQDCRIAGLQKGQKGKGQGPPATLQCCVS